MSQEKELQNNEICSNDNPSFPCFLPAQHILNLVSKKWGIQLIYLLGKNEPLRFTELKETLHQGWAKNKISDATLSARLSEFLQEKLIVRESYSEIPPRVEYFLSKKGRRLSKALEPLIDWAINSCHDTRSNETFD
ncbi:MAG: transcriptional regulator [Candidatus Heimdallarchaeota archaeon]|nr:transcriptional regulator [Candidatus Heimdallarchaeota archaeon]